MEEIRKIVVASADRETVVVGGMAVSILSKVFGVSNIEPCMTTDADFFGDRLAIEQSQQQLSDSGFVSRKYLATLDDEASPNSGRLAVDIAPDTQPVGIDFLFRIDGLATDDIGQKAMLVEVDGQQLKVLHPILLLENKINNLAQYPKKRNEAGVNQARLAIAIARKYLEGFAKSEDAQRPMLQAIERVARLATREASCFAFRGYGLDALNAIPHEIVIAQEFAEKRWPQIMDLVAQRRAKFDELWSRMQIRSDPKKARFRI